MPFNASHPNFMSMRSIISERRAPIVFWIGAGVSSDAGLPSWSKLRDDLSNAALEEMVSWPTTDADAGEAELVDANNSKDLWKSFQILSELLGLPTYRSLVRKYLGPADTVNLPLLQTMIWDIPNVRGVVSLNIDGLEGRAHRRIRTNDSIDEFVGRDIRNHLPTLQSKKQFIARLHGHHSDQSTWVFTTQDLHRLVSDPSYPMALQAIFSGYTVIFLGISADDAAAGGFLRAMADTGMDVGEHFWVTNRVDKETRTWSDRAGLLRVPYDVSENESHTEVILSLFQSIADFAPKDPPAVPVAFTGQADPHIPSLSALRVLPEDDIRIHLNAFAKHLLSEGANRTDTASYQNFLTTFSPVIHQSWHLSDAEGYNRFFNFQAIEKIHSGPFSAVWRVQDAQFNQYALKIIQIENLQKGPQLESFRRGIASQQLLKDTPGFDGFAEIIQAFEIPPSVIMEFVEGENFEVICEKPSFDFWTDGLSTLAHTCGVVAASHKSKFGVLHRDIRPQNIMLPNYYYGDASSDYGLDQYKVKLLNYDLTWHRDATGRVVPIDAGSTGYFAPELLNEPESTRARDARVDSYGIGMTIFRAASGKPPPVAGSSSTDWSVCLQTIKKPKNFWFKSAHNFVGRLIEKSTSADPEDRILVSDIHASITDLQTALKAGVAHADGKFLAESLMYSLCNDDFQVSRNGRVFKRELGGYRSYQIEYPKGKNSITLTFVNSSINTDDWGKIDKVWGSKLTASSEILTSGGWRVRNQTEYSNRVITLAAEIELDSLRSNYEKAEESLVRAVDRVKAS